MGDLPLNQERRRAPQSPAVCFFAGERATQAPIVRGGEGEARAFRRPRSRGKRHVAHCPTSWLILIFFVAAYFLLFAII